MKVFCVVGIRASGKTTTLTRLTEEFVKRGFHVGTVKTIFCPSFSMDDPKSNTFRHRRAGADIICAKAKEETALLIPRALSNREILSHYTGMDFVLLEGDYLAPVPRLVAAHNEGDAAPRVNEKTLAIVGRAAAGQKSILGYPTFNPMADIGALADFLEAHVPDLVPEELDNELPPVEEVTGNGFCQCGCHKHEKLLQEKQGITLTIGGKAFPLTREQKELVLSWAEKAEA